MNVILDVTRFASRVNQGRDTGIDRLERAFINDLLSRSSTPKFLINLGGKLRVLNKNSMKTIMGYETNISWPGSIGIDRFRYKLPTIQRKVRAAFRKLSKPLGKPDLSTSTYFNVGHSNLSVATLSALSATDCKIAIYIHDMIPLDHPEYCRDDTPKKFIEKIESVVEFADHIACNSNFTASRIVHHFEAFGRNLRPEVVYLASPRVTYSKNMERFVPPNDRPNFLALGTIEPRKNTKHLLDIWDSLENSLDENEMPNLIIAGKRGWETSEFYSRLDTAKSKTNSIFEFSNLSDEQILSAMAQSKALLFPSLVEGFGLPVIEAINQDLPVICSDLTVLKELYAGLVVFESNQNVTAWQKKIEDALQDLTKIPTIKGNRGTSKITDQWSIFIDRYTAAVESLVNAH